MLDTYTSRWYLHCIGNINNANFLLFFPKRIDVQLFYILKVSNIFQKSIVFSLYNNIKVTLKIHILREKMCRLILNSCE